VSLDLLYDELDELTSAAAKRHVEHCARCREIQSELRATRAVGVLPHLEPPPDLETRILEAERAAHARLPLRKRAGRGISILAGYAMRPQLAMAALLLLMVGTSLLLLRARPGDRESVQVTERGVPESEGASVAIVPVPEKVASDTAAEAHGAKLGRSKKESREADDQAFAAAPQAAAGEETEKNRERGDEQDKGADGGSDGIYDRGLDAYRAARYPEAIKDFDEVAAGGGRQAPSAALFAAQAVRKSSGCSQAAPRFEAVSSRFRGGGIGHEATWQAADCYRALGRSDDARRAYTQLLDVAGYGQRAQLALASLDTGDRVAAKRAESAPPGGGAAVGPKAKAAPKAAAPPAKPPVTPVPDEAF
jgi:TolA-binding protein